jgi:hypothetical protein
MSGFTSNTAVNENEIVFIRVVANEIQASFLHLCIFFQSLSTLQVHHLHLELVFRHFV